MQRLPPLVIATAALAAVLLSRRASAAIDASTGLDEVDMQDSPPPAGEFGNLADYENFDVNGYPIVSAEIPVADPLYAILYTIRACEHRFPDDVTNGMCYHTAYGGAVFENMADHPVLTGELRGVRMPAPMCMAAGYPSGVCVSTAAGGYQITVPTWTDVRRAGSWGPRLDDFSPLSQDEAARRILQLEGALPLLEAGNIVGALGRASRRWASLPGSTAKQRPKSLEFALARFTEAGTGVA